MEELACLRFPTTPIYCKDTTPKILNKYSIPRKGMCSLSPNQFPRVCERCIYSQDRSAYSAFCQGGRLQSTHSSYFSWWAFWLNRPSQLVKIFQLPDPVLLPLFLVPRVTDAAVLHGAWPRDTSVPSARPAAEFIDPWLGDKVNSSIGFLYRPASLVAWSAGTLIKNEIKISSYIRKFRTDRVSYISGGLLIYMTKYLCTSSYIRKPYLKYDFAPDLSEFPYIWGKFSFLFYQCTTTLCRTWLYSPIRDLWIWLLVPTSPATCRAACPYTHLLVLLHIS